MRLTSLQALGLAWLLDKEGIDVLLEQRGDSPWLFADFMTSNRRYVIWNTTGSVYKCEGPMDEVPDDPIYTPQSFTRHIANDRLLHMMEKVTDERDSLRQQLAHLKERAGVQ